MVGKADYEKRITLPNGKEVSNYSKEYMLWCEALNLSKKKLADRRIFLEKIQEKRPNDAETIKSYLLYIWNN